MKKSIGLLAVLAAFAAIAFAIVNTFHLDITQPETAYSSGASSR